MKTSEKESYLRRLLYFSCGKDYLSEAEKISEAFLSASDIVHSSSHVVKNLSGCTEQTADFLRLVASVTSRRLTDEFKPGRKYTKEQIERYICSMLFHLDIESVYVISLDKNDKLISTDLLTEGTVNSSAFLPRKMVDIALRKKAAKIILAHNHPTGTPMPSNNDIAVTLLADSVLKNAKVSLEAHYITVGFKIYDCLKEIRASQTEEYGVRQISPI